jgi:hypothetical protein
VNELSTVKTANTRDTALPVTTGWAMSCKALGSADVRSC